MGFGFFLPEVQRKGETITEEHDMILFIKLLCKKMEKFNDW